MFWHGFVLHDRWRMWPESNVAAVSKYIATQEEHHRKRSFQEEFVAFLKKNKIAYDERYIWS